MTNKKADGTQLDKYTYEYDAAHNQSKKTDNRGVTSYTYDALNRLETVTDPSTKITTYTYDKAGNRETETTQGLSSTYAYNDQNRLMSVTSPFETTTYGYDNNGNQTTLSRNGELITTNTYDKLNQLITSVTNDTTVTNVYDGDGLRVAKTANGATTKYLYEYDKVVLEIDGSGNQTGRNVYGTNLLMRTADGTSYYYMYNGHADVTALLKPDGEIAATYYYDAFGNITDTTGSANNSITFAGYQYDVETDLYYLNARMYDPKTARFLQEDTYLGDRNDPLSLNLYTYCHNEPLMYTDPTGHLYQSEATDLHVSINSTNNYLSGLISSGGTGVTDYLKNSKALYNQDKFDKLNKNEKKATFRRNDSFSYLSEDSFIRLVQLAEINEINKSINKTKSINTGPSDFYLQATEQAKNQLNRALDGAQAILDAGGLIPVYGEPIDGINGLISLARGNKEDFLLSLAAMAPLGGQAATVTKLGKKGKNLIEGTIDSYRVLSGAGEAGKGVEQVLPKVKSYEQARNQAMDILGDLGMDSKQVYGRLKASAGNGKVIGRQTADNKALWRLDYDTNKGIHINIVDFRNGKGVNAIKQVIPFEGDEALFKALLKHLNK